MIMERLFHGIDRALSLGGNNTIEIPFSNFFLLLPRPPKQDFHRLLESFHPATT